MSRTSTGSSSPPEPAPDALPTVPERPAEIRSVLARLGIRPSKSLGQSFLADPFVADAEASLAVPRPGTPVLEIGAGLGVLTLALLRRGAHPVTVIERDPRLAGFLRTTFGDRIEVQERDARGQVYDERTTVVGNLPFSAATPIVFDLLRARVHQVVVMMQREVAERFAARPGSRAYGRPSILAHAFGTVELFRSVPSTAFEPAPAVEGRVIRFTARSGKLPVTSIEDLERVVQVLFSSRRKQLGNLWPRLRLPDDTIEALTRSGAWPRDWPTRRPEELPPEAYFALADLPRRPPRA